VVLLLQHFHATAFIVDSGLVHLLCVALCTPADKTLHLKSPSSAKHLCNITWAALCTPADKTLHLNSTCKSPLEM
jgi:hypothetical protein